MVLRRYAKTEEAKVELANGVNFDIRSRVVRRDVSVIVLSARETSLIELFVLNRGKPQTKEWLVEHLLNDEVEVEKPANLIEVNLYRLRKRLGPNIIVTRRGVGYGVGA